MNRKSSKLAAQSNNQFDAVGESVVPQKIQEKLPKSVEEAIPNKIYDTGTNASGTSHKTGNSVVPGVLLEIVPTGIERALLEKVHPTKVDGVEPVQVT